MESCIMYQVPKRMWRNESSSPASVGYPAPHFSTPLLVGSRDRLTQLGAEGA